MSVHDINPRLLKSEPMRRCTLDECRAACCLHGVWIDALQAEEIRANATFIAPFMPPDFQSEPDWWFDGREEDDPFSPCGRVLHSRVLRDPQHYGGSACVFLRADHKCALQAAADAHGLPSWRYKPFYCILHPLDLDEQGRITLDDTAELLDEPGSCLRPAAQPIPLLETFEPELRHFLGDSVYENWIRGNSFAH